MSLFKMYLIGVSKDEDKGNLNLREHHFQKIVRVNKEHDARLETRERVERKFGDSLFKVFWLS